MSSTLLIPNMRWQADADEVESAAYLCPLTETVECDLVHHTAVVSYVSPEALQQILLRLAEAGYSTASA